MDKAVKVRRIVRSKYQHANQPFFETTGKLAKTQRTLGCGTCTGCTTTTDCGKCKMCLDKPKFGGPGKQKQRCILRKCQNHPTKPPMKVLTNTNLSLEAQLQPYACMSSKLYRCFVGFIKPILLFTYSFFSSQIKSLFERHCTNAYTRADRNGILNHR